MTQVRQAYGDRLEDPEFVAGLMVALAVAPEQPARGT
jgi:hypothetical protein